MRGGEARAVAARVEQRQLRYQIGVMERVLEEAVEHGANLTRDRLQALVPADMLVSEGARVRGFRIENYGMFFDVEVPTLLYQGTLPWMFRTLDQNDLGLASALETLRAVVQKAGDTNLEQALKRVELQVAPVAVAASSSGASAGSMPPPRGPAPAFSPDRQRRPRRRGPQRRPIRPSTIRKRRTARK